MCFFFAVSFFISVSSNLIVQTGQGRHEDFVEFSEFRVLLLYIRQYLELYVMFERIDTSNDGRISSKSIISPFSCVLSFVLYFCGKVSLF